MPPKGSAGTKWTPEERFKLLLTVHVKSEIKVTNAMWTEVAAAMGNGLTANAVSKQFNAMKKDYHNSTSSVNDNTETASEAAPAPKKRGRPAKTATNGKKFKSEETISDRDSEVEIRPTKKTKAQAKTKARVAKGVQDDATDDKISSDDAEVEANPEAE